MNNSKTGANFSCVCVYLHEIPNRIKCKLRENRTAFHETRKTYSNRAFIHSGIATTIATTMKTSKQNEQTKEQNKKKKEKKRKIFPAYTTFKNMCFLEFLIRATRTIFRSVHLSVQSEIVVIRYTFSLEN